MTWRRALAVLSLAAVSGIGVFLVLVWGATTIETGTPDDAAARVAAVRARFDQPSLLVRGDDGRIRRRTPPPPNQPAELATLHVFAFRAPEGRLVQTDIPFWFFRLKAPAAEFALRGTGLDLEALGVTADDLERHGEGLILDEQDAAGDYLLVWTNR